MEDGVGVVIGEELSGSQTLSFLMFMGQFVLPYHLAMI